MPSSRKNGPARPQRRASTLTERSVRKRTRAQTTADRPSQITEAALRMFAERGFAGTRLEDVALEAGISKAALYLYFDSKERLFEAVIRQAIAPKLEQAITMIDAFEGSTASLVKMLLAVFEKAIDSPVPIVAKLIVAESGNFPELARLWVDLAARRVLSLVERLVQRGIDRGELRPVDVSTVAPLVIAPVFLLGMWRQAFAPHTNFRMDPAPVLAAHAQILLEGLALPDQKKVKR